MRYSLRSTLQGRGLAALLAAAILSLGAPLAGAAAAPIRLFAEAGASPATLLPFPAPAGKSTGAAVVIVPPGATAAADGESIQFARWLNDHGIAGFVLNGGAKPATSVDVNRAVQHLRAHATDLKVAPKRIAVLGFARGAEVAADAAYVQVVEAKADASDPVAKMSGRPDLLGLVWGASVPEVIPADAPPTFLVGSTNPADNMSGMIDLWTKLRGAKISVDAHLFAKADANAGLGTGHPSLSTWPDMFFAWSRFSGFLSDEPRVPVKGMVYLDGNVLASGYVVLTPLDAPATGPVVGRVLNSTANVPIGQFSIPAKQGPIAGRYKIEVYQNMNRWLSNSFTGGLTGGRGGTVTPEQAYFGHHRVLSPSIGDQQIFRKMHPGDTKDYIVEIKPDPAANLDLKIEVFSK